MDTKLENILTIWHKHFEDEDKQYSEFESSDIEYFLGCMLYNNFAFSKALETMKTMDLSYDFLEACSDEYDEIMAIIKSIKLDDDLAKLLFLQEYITEAKSKYSGGELYLLNRLEYHTNEMATRYRDDIEAQRVEFTKQTTSSNPLLR